MFSAGVTVLKVKHLAMAKKEIAAINSTYPRLPNKTEFASNSSGFEVNLYIIALAACEKPRIKVRAERVRWTRGRGLSRYILTSQSIRIIADISAKLPYDLWGLFIAMSRLK